MYSLMPSACHIWHEIYEVLLLLVPSGFLKLLSFQVASMLLLLTLVYVFHGFQSHAAPLTNLLAESSTNALPTVSSLNISACICSADQRTVWEILWSCLARNDNHFGASTVVGRSSLRKALQRWSYLSKLSANIRS